MRQNKEVEELQVEKQKLEKEVQNALDIFKNSKAPNVDEDMRLFVNTQKEYKKLIKYLESLKKVLKFNKKRVS